MTTRALVVLGLCLAACKSEPVPTIDLAAIRVEGAHLRTDTVGEGRFERTATFVLVDARNTATQGAYVTIDGELLDERGQHLSGLLPQVLWIPAGEVRTYALVDAEAAPRPTARSARAIVRRAAALAPPLARIEALHTFDDHGQLVLQAYLVNDAERDGHVVVTAAFHDASGRPLTRPFSVVKIKARQDPATPGKCPDAASDLLPQASKCGLRFVGPPGAVRGTIFVGETVY